MGKFHRTRIAQCTCTGVSLTDMETFCTASLASTAASLALFMWLSRENSAHSATPQQALCWGGEVKDESQEEGRQKGGRREGRGRREERGV